MPKPEMAFDLEGTLVDLERFHQQAFEEVADGLGIHFKKEEFLKFAGAGDAAIAKEIARLGKLARYKLDPREISRAKNEVYLDMLNSHKIEPREGVADYLEKSSTIVGSGLILATITPEKNLQRILAEARLQPFFRYVLSASDVARKKPDPEVYLKAAEILKTPNAKMLVHEDSPVGVAAAKSAGSPVAAFPVLEGIKFEPEPDAVFMSWNGLDPREVIEKIFKK